MSAFFRLFVLFASLSVFAALANADESTQKPHSKESADKKTKKTPKKELYVGKVVMLRPALKSKGVTAFDEFDKMVALETKSGELIPIVPDWRGRAFYQDKRLRDRTVNLVGYRRPGIPFLQVLMVFVFNKKGEREYMDYWCDICSIPMYEIKPCDCCQDPIRIRFQKQGLPDYIKLKPTATIKDDKKQ